MYSALKLSLSNFSGGKKEKTNLSLPPSDCSNISGMSPVTELILWRHQETSLENSLVFFFLNSLKEQLVQIRSQLHEHDGKLLRITKQGS